MMAKKCECTREGKLKIGMADMYDSKTELPFVDHKPGKCRCTNKLAQYHKNDKKVWLCSCCIMGETPVEQ